MQFVFYAVAGLSGVGFCDNFALKTFVLKKKVLTTAMSSFFLTTLHIPRTR